MISPKFFSRFSKKGLFRLRLFLVFVLPTLFFLYVYLSSFYIIKIPEPIIIPINLENPSSSSRVVSTQEDFNTLLSDVFNIPTGKMRYRGCLANRNRLSITFPDGSSFHPLLVSSSTQAGTMNVIFVSENKPQKSVYSQVGSTNCVPLMSNDVSSRQVVIETSYLGFIKTLDKDGTIPIIPTTTSRTQTDKSFVFAYMTFPSAAFLFVFILFSWGGLILLIKGLYNFIKSNELQ